MILDGEEKKEKRLWDLYSALYGARMTQDTFISFEEFVEKSKPRKSLDDYEKEKIRLRAESIKKKVMRK